MEREKKHVPTTTGMTFSPFENTRILVQKERMLATVKKKKKVVQNYQKQTKPITRTPTDRRGFALKNGRHHTHSEKANLNQLHTCVPAIAGLNTGLEISQPHTFQLSPSTSHFAYVSLVWSGLKIKLTILLPKSKQYSFATRISCKQKPNIVPNISFTTFARASMFDGHENVDGVCPRMYSTVLLKMW